MAASLQQVQSLLEIAHNLTQELGQAGVQGANVALMWEGLVQAGLKGLESASGQPITEDRIKALLVKPPVSYQSL